MASDCLPLWSVLIIIGCLISNYDFWRSNETWPLTSNYNLIYHVFAFIVYDLLFFFSIDLIVPSWQRCSTFALKNCSNTFLISPLLSEVLLRISSASDRKGANLSAQSLKNTMNLKEPHTQSFVNDYRCMWSGIVMIGGWLCLVSWVVSVG